MFWTLGFRGRPAVPLITVLGELIDASSVGGAVFDLGSATFDMTRILTGQLDGYVDVGSRMIEEVPALRARSRRSAAARCSTTRPTTWPRRSCAWRRRARWSPTRIGEPLAARPLLGSGHEYQMSCVAAANADAPQPDAGGPRARVSPTYGLRR